MNRFFASALFAASLTTGSALAQTADSTAAEPRRSHWSRAAQSDLTVALGLNALTGDQAPALKPLGSRYVALGYGASLRLSEGRRAAFRLRTGLEVSWYNFMLDDHRLAVQTPTGVAFPDAGRALDKSKLTVAYLNLPLMPTVAFRRGAVQSIGAGGYVGMRLDSYAKVKEESGAKDRTHGRYGLSDLRYGLAAEVNFRHAPTFFVQYDLNPLFRDGQGPKVQGLSFGVRL
jgi:hypothetical protein